LFSELVCCGAVGDVNNAVVLVAPSVTLRLLGVQTVDIVAGLPKVAFE